MEIEMLCRAAMVYGSNMKNAEKAKEYADRVASINPGELVLESIYRLAGEMYDPTQYEDKFAPDYIISDEKEETLPEEKNSKEVTEYGVSIAPNPANPKTTIIYRLT